MRLQALEKSVEAGGALDSYEIEGPDRAELLQDLAEFQLAAVSPLPESHFPHISPAVSHWFSLLLIVTCFKLCN